MGNYILNEVKYGTHRLIAQEIDSGKLVLDIGCNKGYLKQLADGNTFFGIDNDDYILNNARLSGYKDTQKLDLNEFEKIRFKIKFDIIIFGDILEHLLYPEKAVKFIVKKYLTKGGKIIISLPNVANFMIRLDLLTGRFDYKESGILDKTHLHLYTLKTARLFINSLGLRIMKEKFSSNHFGGIIKIFPRLGTLLGHNLIFICRN